MSSTPGRAVEARDAIETAAVRHFTEHGIAGASVTDIAKEAGVSKALVFFHFKSKLGLFEGVASRFLDACTEELGPAKVPSADPAAEIRALVLNFHAFIAQSEGLVRLILTWFLRSKRRGISGGQRPFQKLLRRFQQILAALIQDGVDQGRFGSDVDPDLEARVLLAGLIGLFVQRFLDPSARKDSSDLYEHLLETTLARLASGASVAS